MLVKEDIVKQWYCRDHWIYKNFRYIFQNELWKKSVPNGFSVCPYFWMAVLLSPAIRVLLVWPIKYLITPVPRLIGLDRLDAYLIKKLYDNPGEAQPWSGIGVATMIGLVVSLLSTLLFLVGTATWHFPMMWREQCLAMEDMDGAMASLLTMIAIWTGIPILVGVNWYRSRQRDDSKCKPEVYVYAWGTIMAAVMLFTMPHALGELTMSILGGIWSVISSSAVWVWGIVVMAFSWLFGITGAGLGWLFVEPIFLGMSPFLLFVIPWSIMAIIAWIMNRFDDTVASRPATPEEIRASCRNAWRLAFSDYLKASRSSYLVENTWAFDNIGVRHRRQMAGYVLTHRLSAFLDKAAEAMSDTPLPRQFQHSKRWREQIELELPARYSATFSDLIREMYNLVASITNDEIAADLQALSEMYERYSKEYEQELLRKQKMDALCAKITRPIWIALSPLALLGRLLLALLVFLRDSAVYLWVLAVAKKKKACPYFRFEDTQKK